MLQRSTVALCVLMCIINSSKSFGQFNRGRWLAGGTINFSSSRNETEGNSQASSRSVGFGLGPQAGYFVADKLAIGASLSFSSVKTDGKSFDPVLGSIEEATWNSSSVSFGPFIRYYLPMGLFFQGKTALGSGNSRFDSENFDNEIKTSTFDWGLAAGYAFFLNDYVAIEPLLGYQNNATTDKGNDSKRTNSAFYLSAAFTVYLGERK
jgi:outer membrane protein